MLLEEIGCREYIWQTSTPRLQRIYLACREYTATPHCVEPQNHVRSAPASISSSNPIAQYLADHKKPWTHVPLRRNIILMNEWVVGGG